ncbi:MAG: anti-sigma factor [Allobranchiibius sp.]
MYDASHRHDPREDPARWETLSLLALGENPDTGLEQHIDSCADCQSELTTLRRTVALGRDNGAPDDAPLPTPSESVWDGILAELGSELTPPDVRDPSDGSLRARALLSRRRLWTRTVGLAAAAALIAAAGVTGGYLVGRNGDATAPQVAASASLIAMPGGPGGVRGNATVHSTAAGTSVSIRAFNLPLQRGYYQVWLYDPQADKMVSIGTLPRTGVADLPVPPGLSVTDYHLVDVSAQAYNGNPAHGQSVLQGGLTW